jgi:hypothetical protein
MMLMRVGPLSNHWMFDMSKGSVHCNEDFLLIFTLVLDQAEISLAAKYE